MKKTRDVIVRLESLGYNVSYGHGKKSYLYYDDFNKFLIRTVKPIKKDNIDYLSIHLLLYRFQNSEWVHVYMHTVFVPLNSFDTVFPMIMIEVMNKKYNTAFGSVEWHINNDLEEIAKRYLSIPTLETRHSDSLDFYDIAVWCIHDALKAAYEIGYSKGKKYNQSQ